MKRIKYKVYLAADHAGFRLKEEIASFLLKKGYLIWDFGAAAEVPGDDYPDYVVPCAEAVAKSGQSAVGIVIGGSGLGECIAANKVPGIRAVSAYDAYTVRMSRKDNDANILSLGGRTLSGQPEIAKKLIDLWLKTPFSGASRHRRRLKKIGAYETRRGGCRCLKKSVVSGRSR